MTMQFGSATEFSNKCGVTLMNTPVGRVVAEVMGGKDGVELTEYPSMIRVDGVRLLEFDYGELTDALGTPKATLTEMKVFAQTLRAVDYTNCERADTDTALIVSVRTSSATCRSWFSGKRRRSSGVLMVSRRGVDNVILAKLQPEAISRR